MMKKKKTIHDVEELLSSLLILGKKAAKKPNAENIHNFRLEMKKSRSFLRMLNTAASSKKQVALAQKLKGFYHIAGEVRNLQVQLENLHNHFDRRLTFPAYYRDQLEAKLVEEKKKLNKRWPGLTDMRKRNKKAVATLKAEWNPNRASAFLFLQKVRLHELMSEEMTDTNIHSVRKVVKDILYNKKRLKALFPDKTAFGRLERIAKQLGEHQDCVVALQYLSSPWTADCPPGEKVQLERYEQAIKRKKNMIRNSVLGMAGTSLHSILPEPAEAGDA